MESQTKVKELVSFRIECFKGIILDKEMNCCNNIGLQHIR